MTKCDDCGKNTRKPREWGYSGKMICPACWREWMVKFIEALRRA